MKRENNHAMLCSYRQKELRPKRKERGKNRIANLNQTVRLYFAHFFFFFFCKEGVKNNIFIFLGKPPSFNQA